MGRYCAQGPVCRTACHELIQFSPVPSSRLAGDHESYSLSSGHSVPASDWKLLTGVI